MGIVFSDRWAAGLLAWTARRATGWNVTVRRLRVGLRPPRLQMEGFSVANPKGFPEGDALRIRELYIEYDRVGSTPGETRLRELRINLDQVAMIKRPDGTSNFDELMRTLPQEPPRPAHRRARPSPGSETPSGASPAPAPSEGTTAPNAPPKPESSETPSRRAPAPPVETAEPPPPPKTYRIEQLAVTVGAVEFRTLLPDSDSQPLRITLNRTYVFTNVTDMAAVSNQLLVALTLAATPQLFEEMLRGLMQ